MTQVVALQSPQQTEPFAGNASGRRLWSLWDIMIIFQAHELVGALRGVFHWIGLTDFMRSQGRGAEPFNEESRRLMLADVAKLQGVSLQAGLGSAAQTLGVILHRIGDDYNKHCEAAYLAGELVNAYDAVLEAVLRHRFLRVRLARHVCVDNPHLLGAATLKAFPSAKDDIVEAGNCLAADCNTAAVFHLMRVVEWGLRAFAVHLGVKQLKKSRAKKRATVPVAYSEWEKILDELQDRVDLRIAGMRRGTRKQADQEFFYPILQDIRGIRDAWRNHVMHTRRVYEPRDADAIFSHVHRLMTTLASRISEV